MSKFFTLFIFTVINNFVASATTCTYTATSGNWNNSANWSCGRNPQAGDIINIPAGSVVDVNANISLTGSATFIYIRGTLNFATSDKIDMGAGSGIQIFTNGHLTGDNGDASQKININGSEVWRSKCTGGLTSPRCGDVNGAVSYGTPLPVTLTSFTLTEDDKTVTLQWKTATMKNFSHFEIEKAGEDFNWIYAGSALPNNTGSYQYTDEKSGENYYRLKMIDLDGQFEYSPTLAAKSTKDDLLFITGNKVTVITNEPGKLYLYNLYGACISETSTHEGKNEVIVPGGIYSIIHNGKHFGKFVISDN